MNFNSFFLWLLMKGRFELINYKTNRPSELPCFHAPGLGSEDLQVLGRQGALPLTLRNIEPGTKP
jgi:hypothetical protein